MATIQEQLSAQQQAELAQRAAKTVPPELDFSQLAEPEAATPEATPAPETASPVQDASQPAPGQEATITVNTEARRLPWQTKERRVATSTQGAPKHVEAAQAPQKQARKPRKAAPAKKAAASEAKLETSKRTRTATKKAAETAQPEQPARTVAKKTAAKKAAKKAADQPTESSPVVQTPAQPAVQPQMAQVIKLDRKVSRRTRTAEEMRELLQPRQPEQAPVQTARQNQTAQPTAPERKRTTRGTTAATEAGKLILDRFVTVDLLVYKNGAKHLYGVDEQGKKRHLSERELLEGYGVKPRGKQRAHDTSTTPATEPVVQLPIVIPNAMPNAAPTPPAPPATTEAQRFYGTSSFLQARMGVAWDRLKKAAGIGLYSDAEGNVSEWAPSARGRAMLWAERAAKAKYEQWKQLPENVRKRRLIMSTVIGAAAVGLAFLEARGGNVVSGHGSINEALQHPHPHGGKNPANPNSGIIADLSNHGHGGGTPTQEVTVGRGGNPWDISEHELHLQGVKHPTDAQILSYDKKLGRANGYNWPEWVKKARHLMPGAKLKLPR